MYAHLSAKKKEYEDAAKSLGLETYPVHTYNGVATEVVLKDLGHAIKLLGNLDTINKLNAKRTELSQFLSADEKLAGALNGLKELLK